MLKDIKVSTILLLAVVGVLIYCLMKPSTSSESFANAESELVSESEHTEEMHMPNRMSQQNVRMTQEPDRMTQQPVISPELVSEVLAESEKTMGVGAPNVEGGSVYNYGGMDNEVSSGASLDSAFDKPLPDNTKTDVVDLNKNNVKNYNAKDYLPKEVNDDWFSTDFSQAKYKMNDDKLINTERYVIGINTVGQSLKNASYDIRGAVNVSKYSVSPWNQSTIEPDYNIKPLC